MIVVLSEFSSISLYKDQFVCDCVQKVFSSYANKPKRSSCATKPRSRGIMGRHPIYTLALAGLGAPGGLVGAPGWSVGAPGGSVGAPGWSVSLIVVPLNGMVAVLCGMFLDGTWQSNII